MNWRFWFRTISLLTLLMISACSNANTTTNTAASPTEILSATETEAPATPNTPVIPPTGNDSLCANEYYPVRAGATWTYQSAGSPAGEYGFTDTISSVREDGFTLASTYGDITRSQEWNCTTEGLLALQPGGPILAILKAMNLELGVDMKNAGGITFPSRITAGDQWQHNLDLDGTVRFAGVAGTATGNAQGSFRALGIENLRVPAGTFDAMKVHVDTTVTMTVTHEGVDVPVTFTGAYDYWFAPGIGWVKATGIGNIVGQSFTETIELQSYNIP